MATEATKIPFVEAAAPATPAASRVVVYAKSDGLMYSKDDAGAETLMSSGSAGSVATDSIWDAAGDLAVGSGANTAARLAIGATNGMALQRVSGAVAWALPAGHELDLATVTSPVTVSGTSSGSPTDVVTGASVTYDGTACIVEFSCAYLDINTNTIAKGLYVGMYVDGSLVRLMGYVNSLVVNQTLYTRGDCQTRYTPSAGAHTISIKAWKDSGGTTTMHVDGGTGTGGTDEPIMLRVLKA